ncbi:MAG: alpha/beta fold hydrolase [Dehalococcoidales bacterium]|nr:alpha/beta fold hydrolase [Dehalococcoidales bacterium]
MKKALKITLSVILALVVIFIGISAYLGYSMTRTERIPLAENPSVLSLTYENVTFPSLDEKLILHGWLLPGSKDGEIIIMVHGNGFNRDDPGIGTLDIANQLIQHGYNVLMFDLRGYGESDGSTVSGGYYEKRDVEGAVVFAKERGFEHIGVLGFSLGAVSSLLAAAEDKDIDAVVSDSSYADLNDIMGPEFKKRTKAPELFLEPILFMIKIMYGVDFAGIRPVAAVPEIAPRPVLFIHGEDDDMIPANHAYRLYEAADNSLDELWVVPGAGHVKSFKVQPQEYIERVTAFFDEYLK